MVLKSSKVSRRGFSLLEVSAVILIIGILVAGVMGGNILIAKSRLAAAVTLTNSSPISGIKDSALWLETAVDSSFPENETTNDNSLSTWYDARKSASNKVTITAAGTGPVYSNTINYIHAVKFAGSSTNHLQIADASFLNNTDYTIIILEKRQSNSANNYFFGESPTGTANQKLALGYSLDGTVIHAQGTNSYTSNVSSYADSSDKPKIFTFVSDSINGKKTYINGLLAAQSGDTSQLTGLTTNLPIGKSYTGEIGEIAIFTRPLKAEERKSVEDYMAKKFSIKINRDAVAGGSCTTGTITPSGCSMDCSTASRAGISTPSSITDGQTTNATCGQTGYSGATVSLTCTSGNLSGAACGCNTGGGYSMVGGICVQSCSVSVSGSSTTNVASGVTQVDCDAGGNYATTPFNFSACSGSTITGSCSCVTGYSGSTCSACDTANDYQPVGGLCKKSCTITGQAGITDNTKVLHGSTSTSCGSGYLGNFNYTCTEGTLGSISNNCKLPCTGGNRTVSANGKIIHTFTSGTDNFNCPEAKTVNVLVVGGGGGGGDVSDGNAGGGGGAGGLIYQTNYAISASTNYSTTVGASVAAARTGNNSSFGPSLIAYGGGRGVMYAPTTTNGGSGGGAAGNSTSNQVGTGVAGQGNNGGRSYRGADNSLAYSGGGGGACGGGGDAVAGFGGNGGNGCPIDIDGDGTSVYYAGGGGGGNHGNYAGGITDNGLGGLGGGAGRNTGSYNATPNTGGGGGGGSNGTGASGIVIVAY